MKLLSTFVLSFCLSILSVNCALLGIDFGTEYTKAILVAPGVPFDILLTSESKRKDVSGLAIEFDTSKETPDVHRKFGTHALSTCIKSPQSCMLYLKPLLGLGSADEGMYEYSGKFPGVGLGIQNGRDAATVVTGSKDGSFNDTFLLEEVVAMTFLEIKNRALEYWKERSPDTFGTIEEVVISVPRYFNDASRIAITDAAELAGMKVISLVDDGLATALDYAQKRNDFKQNEKEYHLIFDSGAGSTKASLVSFTNINDTVYVELENYAYSDKFNGELFTIMVRAIILEQFSEQSGVQIADILYDAKVMQKLWQVSEKTKLILSANTETTVNIESLYNDIDFKGYVTREELESRMEISLSAIPNMLSSVFNGFDVKQKLNSVILSGGSIRVPIVQQYLVDFFGTDELISKTVNADESVVFGTTLYGAQLLKLTRKKNFKVIDHSPVGYNIYYKTPDNQIKGSVEVPSGLPSNEKLSFNISDFENQFVPEVNINIFQNNKILTHQLNFTMPKKFNETTCEGGKLEYTMNYGFSKSHVFNVNSIKVQCYPLVNDTISETARIGTMQHVSKYFGFEPMPPSMKAKSINRLNLFEKRDSERQLISDTRNQLESKLYEIRYALEEYEQVLPSSFFEETSANITETLEWLDYESDDATIGDIRDKLQGAEEVESNINKYINVSTYESAYENVYLPYDNLLAQKEKVIGQIEEILAKEETMKKECEKYNLDCDKFLSKLYGSKYPNMEEMFTKVDDELQQIYTTAGLLENPIESDVYAQTDIVPFLEAADLIATVDKNLASIARGYQAVFDSRNDFVSQQITLAKAAAKKAAREAAKEASKEAEMAKQHSDETLGKADSTTAGTVSSTSSITGDHTTSTSDSVEHDEL